MMKKMCLSIFLAVLVLWGLGVSAWAQEGLWAGLFLTA